jgi:hypothetical protein
MSKISKLYIFTKDTDATASLRGYQYQILKTLETWLYNFQNDIQEEIFCDYEDDVFQKDDVSKSVKFRQIKLYSSNFSFKSEEITKCIAHFFMLHVKSDYRNLRKEFVFEANTTIAHKYLDNDAELLREWHKDQNAMSENLLNRCSNKVKEIVSEYVKDQAKALKDKIDKKTLDEAVSIFESLKKEDWDDFTKCIKWSFLNVDSETEIKAIRNNIDKLILELKFPFEDDEATSIFGLLYDVVWDKASQSDYENRKLTNVELEFHILKTSRNDKDKWYIKTYNDWSEVEKINFFLIGEFYEVIDAAKHCRRHKYLFNHADLWIKILDWYIKGTDTPTEFKMTAIYEHIWLQIKFSKPNEHPTGNLFGSETYIEEYFGDFDNFKNANDIENAQNILSIVRSATALGLSNIEADIIANWDSKLKDLIIRNLGASNNPNEICHLLENLVTSKLFHFIISHEDNELKEIEELFEQIIALSNESTYYDISQLSTRINEYIKIILSTAKESDYELIDFLEDYSEKLVDIVQKRQGNYNAGKIQIDRGVKYLYRTEPVFCLKALNCFHKAKDLWNQQETIEGHILALINISQLYAGMDMNLAAKYYALSGVWLSVYNGEVKLLRRIADSLGMLFSADFKQGSWMNAIIDFHHYIIARHELYPSPIDFENELTMPLKTIGDFALIAYSSTLIQPELKYLIENETNKAGYINEEYIIPLCDDLSKKHSSIDSLTPILFAKLSDNPLNDTGEKRTIKFMALGSKWEIFFKNDFITNSVAEEFISILQILLCEIALSDIDFHLTKGTVKIEIEIKDGINQPEELPTHKFFSWKVFVPYFEGKRPEEISLNNASGVTTLMIILNRVSLLPDSEFQSLFDAFFQKNSLSTKTLSLNAYQKMYRLVFNKDEFDSLQRTNFNKPSISIGGLPKENDVVKWKSDLSLKYNHDLSIEYIANRYKSSQKCIYITLEKLLKNTEFHKLVNKLREDGWQDWFIVLTMMNFILNHKAQRELDSLNLSNEEEKKKKLEELFFKFRDLDEKDYYVEFPIDAFKSKWFDFQLQNTCVTVLRAFNLENKAKFPNFEAVKEFLDIRFNMSTDKDDSENPLIIIPTDVASV